MFNISKELIIVLVIVLVIFGPSQLPKLGKMFGKTMKNVREGMDATGEDEDETPAKPKEMEASEAEETPTPEKKTTVAEDDAE